MNTNSKIKNHIKNILADVLALTIAGAALATSSVIANAKTCHTDNECLVEGYFEDGLTLTDTNRNSEYHYHFKACDNSVWWFITADELGFVPKADTLYYFVYDDNGTTFCDCPPEYDCDCFVYDDTFISCTTNSEYTNSEIENSYAERSET